MVISPYSGYWDGPVVDGRIVFDHSELVSTNYVIQKISTRYLSKEQQEKQLHPEYYDDSIVYTFTNYTPKPHESVSIGIFVTDWHTLDNYKSNRCPDWWFVTSTQQAAAMKNEFYALHGYDFKDDSLSRYYKKRNWYTIDSSFDSTKLSEGDEQFLLNLSGINKRHTKRKMKTIKVNR